MLGRHSVLFCEATSVTRFTGAQPACSIVLHPLQVSFPLANMRCGGASCNNKGRFKVAAFAALSRFNGAGDFLSDANYKSGKEVLATTIPTEDVYFGAQNAC